ncbi:hypothetical protein [Methanobrevibacter sp.]|uniref:hypothetical protein n=1 Tax=Methanobrevibacter sp. TaxID=66852 RepID=UPI0026DFB89A|nr:hypothetical protein [Methanobrevibacter sp.]
MVLKNYFNKKLLLGIVFIFLICINCSFANPTDDLNNVSMLSSNVQNFSNNHVITNENFADYFANNELKSEYENQSISFSGNFTDLGTLKIANSNVNINCNDSYFINTGFHLKGENITLANGIFLANVSFPNSDDSLILIENNGIKVSNNKISYITPNSTAHGIYLKGSKTDSFENVSISNNDIYFESHNLENGYNYALAITYADDVMVYGNKINTSLPLRPVSWNQGIYGGIGMEFVATIAFGQCEHLTMSGNYIYTSGNGRFGQYPTLDACLLYKCDYSLIENNTIIEVDYDTPIDVDNYLYAIDMFLCDDTTVVYNNVHVRTTGGQMSHGTAYPMQVTGPSNNLKLAFNNISSVSNGPNIGIYSSNFYGETHIHLVSNHINITGRAGGDSWALVAGIEVQDTNDLILNNTIEVHNTLNSSLGNLYGISYSQPTNYDHAYNIQYNTVISEGQYAVTLKGQPNGMVVDTIVANNQIVSSKGEGNKAVMVGGSLRNVTVKNNTGLKVDKKVMSEELYPDWLKDYLEDLNNRIEANKESGSGTPSTNNTNTEVNNNTSVELPNNSTSGNSSIAGNQTGNGTGNVTGNNTISGNATTDIENSNSSENVDSNLNGDSSNNFENNGNIVNDIVDNANISNSTVTNSTLILRNNVTSSISPGLTSQLLSSESPAESASASKAHEVSKTSKKVKSDDLKPYFIVGIVVLLALLLVGYKRYGSKED